jgi:hypothetical protein
MALRFHGIRRLEVVTGASVVSIPVAGIGSGVLPLSRLEAAGFATGALSVWLAVLESAWT